MVPLMGCSVRLPRKALSALPECRWPTAAAALSSRAMAGPVEAAVVSRLSRARSAVRLLPAGVGSEGWRPFVRPTAATPVRARPQGRLLRARLAAMPSRERRQALLAVTRPQAGPQVPSPPLASRSGFDHLDW